MKKQLLTGSCIVLALCLTSGCSRAKQASPAPAASAPAAVQPQVAGRTFHPEFDTFIPAAAAYLDEHIKSGVKTALINFSTTGQMMRDWDDVYFDFALTALETELLKTEKIDLVYPPSIIKLLGESRLKTSSFIDDQTLRAFGQKLGAEKVVSCILNITAAQYEFMMLIYDVQGDGVQIYSVTKYL
jgi:hypothetical protein